MDNVFYWTGLTVLTLSAVFGSLFVIFLLLKWILDFTQSRFKVFGIMVQYYAYYRKDFKYWYYNVRKDKNLIKEGNESFTGYCLDETLHDKRCSDLCDRPECGY